MAVITKPFTFTANTTIASAQVNSDFDTLYTEINGNLDNANIKSGAAISTSKISGTAVNLSDAQTLTGAKTITKSIQVINTESDASTVTFDLSAGNIQQVTLGGNRTLALSNASVGQVFVIRLVQDEMGSRTVTWFSTINWTGGVEPTLSTAAAAIDVFGFICTATDTYDGFIIGSNLS